MENRDAIVRKYSNILLKLLLVTIFVFSFMSTFVMSSFVQAAAPADVYWVGNSGNWTDAITHWSNSSGGVPAAINIPDSGSNVHFDINSFNTSSQIVTINASAFCKDMVWTGSTNTPTLAGSSQIQINGNCTLISAMTITHTGVFVFAGSGTFISNIKQPIQVNVEGTSLILGDDLSVNVLSASGQLYIGKGTFNTNNKNISCNSFVIEWPQAKVITFGSSIITAGGNWDMGGGTGITFYCNTSTINLTGVESITGSQTYNIINIIGNSKAITGNNTLSQFNLASSTTQTVTFTDGTTQTVSTTNLNGSSGHIHTLKGSSTAGWNITKVGGGRVLADYVALTYSNALPANTFYYGANSTVGAGVTGWNQGQFTLTYTNGSNGTITGVTSQTKWIGENGSAVTAVPNACYSFLNWSDGSTANPRTDTNVSANVTVTANYYKIPYTLNITSTSGGNVTLPGEGTFNVNCEDSIYLIALNNSHYHFVNWTGNVSGISDINSSITNITMTADHSIIANFAIDAVTLNLTASPVAGGIPTFTGFNPFPYGALVNISANTISGYRFMGWTPTTGIVNPSAENTAVTLNGDKNLTANYTQVRVLLINTMANMIAIVLGAVLIVILLGFAFVEIKNNGLTEIVGVTFLGIIGLIVIEVIIVAVL